MESLIILKIVACGQVGTAPVPDLMARCRQMNVQAADRPVLSWDNDSYLLLDALGLTALDNLVSSEEQVRFMTSANARVKTGPGRSARQHYTN